MRANEEGQRAEVVRGDASPCTPLVDLLTGLGELAVLQGAKSAVQRALMIEREAAAEIRSLDERDAESALRGVVGREQPVDPAADDQQIESPGRQRDVSRGIALIMDKFQLRYRYRTLAKCPIWRSRR